MTHKTIITRQIVQFLIAAILFELIFDWIMMDSSAHGDLSLEFEDSDGARMKTMNTKLHWR